MASRREFGVVRKFLVERNRESKRLQGTRRAKLEMTVSGRCKLTTRIKIASNRVLE